MKIVITGASGNVGTALIRALAADGRVSEIVGVARRMPQEHTPKVRWVTADLARQSVAAHLDGAGALVNLAWSFRSQHHPRRTWATNVRGAIELFESAARAEVPSIVHASSVGAYAPRDDAEPVDESWPTHAEPSAAYGREKSYLERYLDGFEAKHPQLRVVRIRSAFVFQRSAGEEQLRIFGGPLVHRLVGRRGALELLPLLPLPRSLRIQAVHADDLAAAYGAAVLGDAAGAFNIAAEPPLYGRDLAALIGVRHVPVPDSAARLAIAAAFHARLVPTEPGLLDLALSLPVMDSGRARRELRWEPRRTAREAIAALLDGLDPPASGSTPPLSEAQGPKPALSG
jgi:nucleoside-diphosphate-sugar epimerase